MTLHEKVILSAYTGILMCNMSEVHKYIEKLLSRPVEFVKEGTSLCGNENS